MMTRLHNNIKVAVRLKGVYNEHVVRHRDENNIFCYY